MIGRGAGRGEPRVLGIAAEKSGSARIRRARSARVDRVNHAMDAWSRSEVEQQPELMITAPQVVVQLPASARIEAFARRQPDEESSFDQEIDPEASDDLAIV